METAENKIRICTNGHRYFKSSDCPVCPICEKHKPTLGDLPKIAAPARRALENARIYSLLELSKYSEDEILEWHGIGPNVLKKLKAELKNKGLFFKEK